MKKFVTLIAIVLIATSCNLQAKKGSIGEVDLDGKKVYVYLYKEHQVVGHWTSASFDVIHDPDCPFCIKKEHSTIVDSSMKKETLPFIINVYNNDKPK
jgi:hypothetical protein